MAISNYTELKNAIYKWLIKDTDDAFLDSATVDNIIFLAEKELSRRLRVRQTRDATTLSLTAGNNSVALPADFLQVRSIYFNTPLNEVRPASISYFNLYNLYGQSGVPKYYYLGSDDNIIFGPTPDTGYTLQMEYDKFIEGLSGSNTTNALLTAYPDLYLTACLQQAYMVLEDDDNEAKAMLKLDRLIDSVQKTENRSNMATNTRGTARKI